MHLSSVDTINFEMNTIANPAEILNEEIESESTDHQFFYSINPTRCYFKQF